MAESVVQVTEGVGKKLHTWSRTIGANTVEDEFTLPGEYPLASYVMSASGIGIGTANDHLMQLMAGASLVVRIRAIEVTEWTLTTSSTIHRLDLWRLSTAGTGGTAITAAKLDNADGSAGAQGMTLPTVKGTESTRLYSWGTIVSSAVTGSPTEGYLLRKRWEPNEKGIVIAAGVNNGIAIKNISTQAVGQVTINIEFVETSF